MRHRLCSPKPNAGRARTHGGGDCGATAAASWAVTAGVFPPPACRAAMAPPIEGGEGRAERRGGGFVGGNSVSHKGRRLRVPTGAPIGAQACSPRKPFVTPSPFNTNRPLPVLGGSGMPDPSSVMSKVSSRRAAPRVLQRRSCPCVAPSAFACAPAEFSPGAPQHQNIGPKHHNAL